MRINFLPTDRFPYTAIEIILAGLILAPDRQVVCARCDVVLRPGAQPEQRDLCPACFDRVVA
jgi:hypothetical protein